MTSDLVSFNNGSFPDFATYKRKWEPSSDEPREIIHAAVKNLFIAVYFLGIAILHIPKAPFIGADLLKIYAFTSLRALECAAGFFLYFIHKPLGAYLSDEGVHFGQIYWGIYRSRLKSLDYDFLK